MSLHVTVQQSLDVKAECTDTILGLDDYECEWSAELSCEGRVRRLGLGWSQS